MQGKVGVVLACMDCRLHPEEQRFHSQLKETLGVDHLYVVTTAGPDGKILADDHHCRSHVENIMVAIEAKGAEIVGVVAHYDCAGHPVSNEQHEHDVVKAAEIFAGKLRFDGPVVPLIAAPEGARWVVREASPERAAA